MPNLDLAITPANMGRLEAALAEVQKGCRVRLVRAEDLPGLCARVERFLRLPRRLLEGTHALLDPHAAKRPNYHDMDTTQLSVDYRAGRWVLARAYRQRGNSQSATTATITLSEAAQAYVADRAIWAARYAAV